MTLSHPTRRPRPVRALPPAAALLLAATAAAQTSAPSAESSYQAMTIEQLLNLDVVSASNRAEKLSEAPATVIVISRDDILQRGYTEVDQIFDDLPGMHVSRPYGDTFFKNYWRGFRNNIGEPFLVMLDGVVFNQLYNNQGEVITAMPLSDVERIEVVYGPASSVYGPNAFMGVINVITLHDRGGDGGGARAGFSGGKFSGSSTQGPRTADLHYLHRRGELRFSLAARADYGSGNWGTHNGYEFTKDSYYADRNVWGALVDSPQIAGAFYSPKRNLGVDARLYFKELELAAQVFQVRTGYGAVYPGELIQNNAIWDRVTTSLYLRDRHEFSNRVSGTTLFRFTEFDIKNDSFELDSFDDTVGGVSGRYVQATYWQSLNRSWSLYQDFAIKGWSDDVNFTAGFKYEQKNLQKAYDIATGPEVLASAVNPRNAGFFPTPPSASLLANNRKETEDYGAYVLGRWRRSDALQFNLGLRTDHNSQYGSNTTFRGGYVGRFGEWGVKALYGQAFNEPSPRLLYGGWKGSGSDPAIGPEKSSTFELSGSWTRGNFSALLSGYRIINKDTIISVVGGAKNLGERKITGLDLHGQAAFNPAGLKSLRLWGYYSHLFNAKEQVLVTSANPALNGGDAGFTQRIGDLADDMLHAGATAVFTPHLSATLRGRWIGSRPTVLRNPVPAGTTAPIRSNPVPQVDSYATFDLNLVGSDLGAHGLGFSLAVENLANKSYFEPGIRGANAGVTPGYYNPASGAYVGGAASYYNSLLPQPGRLVRLMLRLDY